MFIVFEGIDGCGKSTQIKLLAEYLYSLNKYSHILLTREPYKDKKIREVLKQAESEDKAKILTELFIEDRKEHIKELILPNLNNNVIILSDRYKYSTICYQSAQGQDISGLVKKHEGMPSPDLIFILDIQSKIAFNRMQKRNADEKNPESNKFEESIQFLEKVRQNYLKMKSFFPEEKIIIVDGEKSADEIFNKIKEYFLDSSNNI